MKEEQRGGDGGMRRRGHGTEHGCCGGFGSQTTDISIKYPSVAPRVLLTTQLELYIFKYIFLFYFFLLTLRDLDNFEKSSTVRQMSNKKRKNKNNKSNK